MASLPPPPPPPPLPGDFPPVPPPPAATTTAAVSTPPAAAAAPVSEPQQPAAAAADEGKQWDKPWSTSVVRQNAKQWSLAGDTALLLYLKDMSADMISRTHNLAKEIDNLSASIKTCEVSTNNAFNEFITLANNQFVENRVYDEDVSQSAAAGDSNSTEEPKKEKSKEEVEGELIPKISEAVKLGLNVLDTAYERLEVNIDDADSDDDEPYQGEPMLEIKDPYILRSLPVLIGSEAFHLNDNVGLIDVPSEEEGSDHGSISESEEEDVGAAAASDSSEYSYSDSDEETNQTSNRRPIPPTAQMSSSSSSESDDDDMFGTSTKSAKKTRISSSESESEAEAETVPSSGAPVDFASELAKKIGMPASQTAEVEKPHKKKAESKSAAATPSKHSGKSKKSKKKAQDDDDLFGAADSDDEDGLFSSRGGLFDSGGGLFDNSAGQDDGGLFDDVEDMDVSQLRSQQKKQAQASSSEEDSEEEEVPKAKLIKAKQVPAKKAAAASRDLFGADSDEDDLFAVSKPKATRISESDSVDDELLKPKEEKSRARTASGRKVPAGAISMFGGTGGGNPLAAALSKRRKSSSVKDEEEDDWGSGKSRENSISKPAAEPSKSAKTKTGLFSSTDSDGEDDGLFSEPKAVKQASPQSKKKMPAGAVSMFGGSGNPLAAALKSRTKSILSTEDGSSEDEEPTKPSAKSEAPSGKSIVAGPRDDEDEEGDLFGSKENSGTTRSVKKPAGGVSLFGGADLFGTGQPSKEEERENKPPTSKASPKKSSPIKQSTSSSKPSKGLFSDSDDENDLFASKSQVTTKPTATKKSTKGLFSDSDSEEDAAPPSIAPSKAAAQPISSQKSKGGLFGESDDNDDMFSAPAKAAPPTAVHAKAVPNAAATKQAAKKLSPNKGLFGGSDEDDEMFGSDSQKSAPEVKPESANPLAKSAANESLFDESDEEKPSLAAAVAKPSSAKPAADMFDDSDDDDLFSGKTSKAKSTNASSNRKPASSVKKAVNDSPLRGGVVAATKTSTKPAAALFENASDDDDMFGTSAPAVAAKAEVSAADADADVEKSASSEEVEDRKPVEQAKPKRPAGAVSMFGGMDPTALLKKKSPAAANKPAAKPSRKSVPTSSLFDSDSDDDLFSSKHTRKPPRHKKAASKAAESSVPDSHKDNDPVKDNDPFKDDDGADSLQLPSSVTVKKPAAKKLMANIGINPLAMMPGAAPPKKEAAPQAVGFDIPAENTNVLHSLNKSRAKVQQKRRPPSRHAHGKTSSAAAEISSPAPAPQVNSSLDDRVPTIDSPAVTTNGVVEQKQKVTPRDPFLDDSDDDFFSPKSVSQPPVAAPMSPPSDGDVGFTQPSTKSDTPTPPASNLLAEDSDDADIFSKTHASDDVTKKATLGIISNGQSNVADTHSDVRSPSPVMDGPPPLEDYSSPDTSAPTASDAFVLGDSDDDIFSVKPAKTSKQTAVADIFDDDELFTSSKPAKKKPVLDDLDDDDLFSSKPVKTKRQKAFTKDEDLFGDDDIFADIAAKSKEKKSRAGSAVKKTQPSKKATIDDDMDDLFADLGAKKSKNKKLDLDDDDLFGDPLGGLK